MVVSPFSIRPEHERYLQHMGDWSFDIFAFNEVAAGQPLLVMTWAGQPLSYQLNRHSRPLTPRSHSPVPSLRTLPYFMADSNVSFLHSSAPSIYLQIVLASNSSPNMQCLMQCLISRSIPSALERLGLFQAFDIPPTRCHAMLQRMETTYSDSYNSGQVNPYHNSLHAGKKHTQTQPWHVRSHPSSWRVASHGLDSNPIRPSQH